MLLVAAPVVSGLYIANKHTAASQTTTAKASTKPTPQTHTTTPTPTPITSTSTPVVQTPTAHADAGLSQIVNTWQNTHSFAASITVRELTGDLRTASSNANASIVPASTYKIYVAYAILHGIEQGSYTLTTATDDGKNIQIDLNNMILNSDNDAARTLGFLYGWKNINALLQAHGINSTNLYNYVPPSTQPVGDKHSTANDLATVLQKLQAGSLLNPSHTQLLLNLMQQQHYRERIPSGVPSTVTVADKPGWLTGNDDPGTIVQNDAAIVYGPKSTYILVITTANSSTQPLANLSQLIYNYLEK